MSSRIITIKNIPGIHARIASKIVHFARRYEAELTFRNQNKTVNAKSILGLLALEANQGTSLEITTEGSDAEELLNAIVEFLDKPSLGEDTQKHTSKILRGIPVSPGISIGRCFLLDKSMIKVERYDISKSSKSSVPAEIKRFKRALATSKEQLIVLKRDLKKQLGEQAPLNIMDVHLMVLDDETLINQVIKTIKELKVNAEWALRTVINQFTKIFEGVNDAYLQSRKIDIDNVGERILYNLVGKEMGKLGNFNEEVIIVAHDLTPTDAAQMHHGDVIGFATFMGGRTSHTAIIAKSLEIPAVIGVQDICESVETGDPVIIDGNEGIVIINPTPEEFKSYLDKQNHYKYVIQELLKEKDTPAETLDKYEVKIHANIEFIDEIPQIISRGIKGVGLYRTEFLYMGRKDLPPEEEHFQAYKVLAEQIKPSVATIRTLDMGGDKIQLHLDAIHQANPVLGFRAIRFCLQHKDIFKMQLRAILKASTHGNLKILYPMISGLEELREANKVLEEVKQELRAKHISFNEDIPVGVMIEIPSAAATADLLSKEADFFSIGTNDLIQYTIAIDRNNEHVAYLYEPLHPAVLRSIRFCIEAAHSEGIEVSMCGEMAGAPLYTLVLLGLGLDEFSMNASAVPIVKKIIRLVNFKQARDIAQEVMKFSTSTEIKKFVTEEMTRLFPQFFESLKI
ncbi:MAG: phosphoenolpyruvate--protein phosphotransferase [bacterium]